MSRCRPFVLASLLLLCGAPPAVASALRTEREEPPGLTAVAGRVLGYDGKPLRAAHVRIAETFIAVERDGRFALQVPGRSLAHLSFSGVGHTPAPVRVALDGRPVQLDIRLGTDARPDLPRQVVLVWWGPGAGTPSELPMQRDGGTYRATLDVPAGQVRYQLRGVSPRLVSGPQAEAFEEDGAWDYRSILRAPGGALQVVFDPRRLPPAGLAPRIAFADPSRARLHGIARAHDARQRAAVEVAKAAAKRGTDFEAARRAFVARQHWGAQLEAERRAERDPVAHAALLIAALALVSPEHATLAQRRLAHEAIATIPVYSPLWGLEPESVRVVAALLGRTEQAQDFLDALAQSSPDVHVVAAARLASERCTSPCKRSPHLGVGPMSSGREATP